MQPLQLPASSILAPHGGMEIVFEGGIEEMNVLLHGSVADGELPVGRDGEVKSTRVAPFRRKASGLQIGAAGLQIRRGVENGPALFFHLNQFVIGVIDSGPNTFRRIVVCRPISGLYRMNRASQLRAPAVLSGSNSMGRKLMAKPTSFAKRTMSGSSSRFRLLTTQLIVGMDPETPVSCRPM